VLHQRGLVHLVKYIDDFLVAGSAGSPACQSSVTEMCSVCEELGLPLAMEKLEGPAQVITFLGIELDSSQHADPPSLGQVTQVAGRVV